MVKAKVKVTNDYIVLNWKLVTSFSGNFHCKSSDILFSDLDIQGWVKYQMTHFFTFTFNWKKFYDL